jgi:hypothetical protein
MNAVGIASIAQEKWKEFLLQRTQRENQVPE